MIIGCLKGYKVNDQIYVQLSQRLWFVVTVSTKSCHFCRDIRKDMNAPAIEWTWLVENLDYLFYLSERFFIGIFSNHRVRKWPMVMKKVGIDCKENGKKVVGITYDELTLLSYRFFWISEILQNAERTCLGSSDVSWSGCKGKDIFNDPEQCDLLLSIGTKQYHVSKKCLSKSPVLCVMLTSPNWRDSTLTELRLIEMEEVMPHMESFLRFMHSGKIEITKENMVPLIQISNKYNTRELDVLCERAMDNILFSGIPIEQVIQWWFITKELNFKSKCKEYLQLNLMSVFSSELFKDLGLDELILLLEGNKQVIDSEITLFKHVLEWLEINDRMSDLQHIMPHIKLSYMPLTYMRLCVERFLLAQGQIEHLYKAMRFHACPVDLRESTQYYGGRYYTDHGFTVPCKAGPLAKYYRKTSPSTCSNADEILPKKIVKAKYRSLEDGSREIHVITDQLSRDDHITMADISVVVYSEENSVQFVKGICQTTVPLEENSGHKLIIQIPKANISAEEQKNITVIPRYFIYDDPKNCWDGDSWASDDSDEDI